MFCLSGRCVSACGVAAGLLLLAQPAAAGPAGSRIDASEGPGGGRPLRVGLNANTQAYGARAGAAQDRARATGARWLREDFEWDLVQPRPNEWDWSRYDGVVAGAAARGMVVLPLLSGSASWAAPAWNVFPPDRAAYGEYVARVVARYGPGGTFWRSRPALAEYAPTHFELWNEPYLELFSIDRVDPARYARLVRTAVAAGRAANPRARFLIEADTFYTAGPGDYRNWIHDMYRAVPGLSRWFDGVAVHPYSSERSPDVYTPRRPTRWQFRRIEEERAAFVSHGAADKPFWITEIGWSTCGGDTDCVSEGVQAANIARVFELARTRYRSFVEAVFVYHLDDWGPADGSNKDYWFGLTRRDGSRKPAFAAVRDAARQEVAMRETAR
jgi:hypothetical protein